MKHKDSKTVQEAKEEISVTTEVPEIKVSSLGAKKSRSRRGRGGQRNNASETESRKCEEPPVPNNEQVSALEVQIQTLNERISVLESEKSSLQASANKLEAHVNDLDSQILALEDQLSSANEEKRTLQQRVELLLTELNAETPGKFYYLFS